MPYRYLRQVRFRPFLTGKGPKFTLTTWHNTLKEGCLKYKLVMSLEGKSYVLFEGDDYKPSILVQPDSDEAIEDLMGFLTLRPGDTDKEYFDKYTPGQLDFCAKYAETLSGEVSARFQKA